MTILALDPGGTTGWAYVTQPHNPYPYAEHLVGPHHRELYMLLCGMAPAVIVCESFEYRNSPKERTGVNLMSREYIGVVTLYCQESGVPLVMQTPMKDSNAQWNDEALSRAGILKTPKSKWSHANDAMRHLMYYLTNSKDVPLEVRQYWLGRGFKQ